MTKKFKELVLPNILVKVIQEDHKLKLLCGDRYVLEIDELPDKPNTYPLLFLDRYVTEVTTKLLKAEMKKQEFKQNFLQVEEQLQEQNIVEGLIREVTDGTETS